MLEDKVLQHLKQNQKAYTRPMFYLFDVKKSYGISLNKFRLFLRDLEKQGKIKEVFTDEYSYWRINNAE